MKGISIAVASGRGVADRWREQYLHRTNGWGNTASGPAKDIHEKLCALGQNPTPEQVADVVGNKSWSYLSCSGCNEYIKRAVQFSDSWSEDCILLCDSCVEAAKQALADGTKTTKAE